MTRLKSTILLFGFLCSSTLIFSQQLLDPFISFSKKKPAYVTMEDGKEIVGTIRKLYRNGRLFKKISLKLENGEKISLPAEEISHMYLPQSAWGKFGNAFEKATDLTRKDEDNLEHIRFKEGYAYFEKQEVTYKKKKRTLLLQLLNPHFSSQIKIYYDPYAGEAAGLEVGGFNVAGGGEKSYYVKIGEGETFRLKKKDYKKKFKMLFGDCKSLMKEHAKRAMWKRFNEHVYEYTTDCK